AAFPDREQLEMGGVFRRMFHADVARPITGEEASTEYDITVPRRVDLTSNPQQATRKEGVVGVQEPEDLALHAGKTAIQCVGLAGVAFNIQFKYIRPSLNERFGDRDGIIG